jgi:glycosyltransferase involved in cell wall biosynthesis
VANHEPRGLGGARNSGVAVAQGAVIAFLDDDAVAAPRWLAQLQAGYACPDVVGVGGAITPLWSSERPGWFPEEFYWILGCSYRGTPRTPAAVRNLFGCNMSFRREVFGALGGFHLGYGCDETEFCIRVRQRWPQSALLYNPQARVHHRVVSSRARWCYFCSRCYFEGRSKAVVSCLVGRRDGLGSEWSYTLRTLPQGVIRGVADAALHGKVVGFSRAGLIVAGLAITTAGYLTGTLFVMEAAHERGWSGHQQRQRT